MKKIPLLFIIFSFVMIMLLSCGLPPVSDPPTEDNNTESPPENEGNTENEDLNKLILVDGGKVNFTITHATGVGAAVVNCANEIVNTFEEFNLEVKKISDAKEISTEYEIILGSTKKRGDEYYVDSYANGEKGYSILAIDKKIVVTAGSDDALKIATKKLLSECFGISKNTKELTELKIPNTYSLLYKQEGYKVSKIDICGTDIGEYVINVFGSDTNAINIASVIQDRLYKDCGYRLEKTTGSNVEKQITVAFTQDAGEDGFRIRINGNALVIECAFKNAFLKATEDFLDIVTTADGSYSFPEDFYYTKHVSSVRYSDFEAVGDGVTDDFNAMKAAHEYANEGGQTVYADEGATYYIGNNGASRIVIKTDTVWTGATIIIDDDSIGPYDDAKSTPVFQVSSNFPSITLSPGTGLPFYSLSAGQKTVDYKPGFNALIIVKNAKHESFIRHPGYDGTGEAQQELFLIDEEGNVDPSTPICWDYTEITHLEIHKTDDIPITILGGHIISNVRVPREHTKEDYSYYARGLLVMRSNVTVKGLTHTLQNEPITGSVAYGAFLSARNANNVTFEDCMLQAHRVIEDVEVRNGSYDTGAYMSNKITWLRCKQINYATHNRTGEFLTSVYDENGKIIGTAVPAVALTGCWGIMGSNYCKNLTYDSSILSRFDAHCGVHNAKIINSEVTMINLIGSGVFELINSKVNNDISAMISLRTDYGSTWRGDLIIKNTHFNSARDTVTLIGASWYNHNYGYKCYMPENIVLENLTFENATKVNIFTTTFTTLEQKYGNISTDYILDGVTEVKNINPYAPTKTVTVINPDKKVTYFIPHTQLFEDLIYETKYTNNE